MIAVATTCGGETTLVTGDLAQLDQVHRLADQIRANGPVDALVHTAGVWVRGDTPRTTADGLETTFAVNVLAPHLLTSLLAADLQGRLLWLGSGSANFGRPDPATLGRLQQWARQRWCWLAPRRSAPRQHPGRPRSQATTR